MVFDNDIFTLQRLTAAINEIEYKPRRLGEMGLFDESGINTTSVLVEREGSGLSLVPSKERGAPGTVIGGDKRRGFTFSAIHLPTRATIMADEVQNVRAFDTEDQGQALQIVVNKRLTKIVNNLDVTHEWQRIGAVKGQILDSDGTMLVDLYSAFGITQKVVPMALNTDTTDVRIKCLDVLEAIEEGLGGIFFGGAVVLCGKSFWRKLISHPTVKEAYMYQQSERMRADGRESFSFGGLVFERYRGTIGTTAFVPDTEAYAIPTGTTDMFITNFAPADYMDAVNTIGLPFYSSSKLLDHNKGIELEGQSNPIHLNTRPQGVIKLKESAS